MISDCNEMVCDILIYQMNKLCHVSGICLLDMYTIDVYCISDAKSFEKYHRIIHNSITSTRRRSDTKF